MKEIKNKLQNKKDKIAGEVKKGIGKATNNKELEMKGRVQSSKSDIKEKTKNQKRYSRKS